MRILPLLEIDCTETHCGDCDFLRDGPRCGLLTGELEQDEQGPIRCVECLECEEFPSRA